MLTFMAKPKPSLMTTAELEIEGHTHNSHMFGAYYQVPTEYHAKQRWYAVRKEFKRRTGHDPRPYYER